MIMIQDSPEFTFCETVISRLRENEHLCPLVLEQPYDRDDQTQKLALADRQYDGAVAVMPAGLGMDWQGADTARVCIWTARVAVLIMVTAKTEEESGLRRSTVDYDEGVSVGGVEVATVTQVQTLGADVRTAAANSQAAAQSAAAARDEAQAAVAGLSITVGTVTTGGPGTQAAATLTPGSTPGSWQLDMAIPRGDVGSVDTSKSYTWTQPQVFDATVTASRGVRVPLPATAQEALSYEALVEQQTADDWRRMNYYMETLIPSWVTTLVRQMQMSDAYNVVTANASSKEAVYTNDLHDFLITMTPASGISLLGRSTGAWKFANYMGDHNNSAYAAAVVWRIIGSDKASILLGSTSQGYSSTTNPAAPCYAHPIHWADYNLDTADYRYPLLNAVNNYTSRDMAPAWQVTIYPTGYLGSTASCLIRGTDYGRDVGDQLYMWALVPKITYLAVAMAPRAAVDHQNVMNRWELFVDGNYVMPMTSLFCGSGHTACVTVKAKAHAVSSSLQVGMRMGGMRIDSAPALGVNDVRSIMGRVVMDGVTVKPVPEVTTSALEVSAEGGEVTLTASSALAEAIYVLNDTMCGHDAAAVWCSQSTEQIPAGTAQQRRGQTSLHHPGVAGLYRRVAGVLQYYPRYALGRQRPVIAGLVSGRSCGASFGRDRFPAGVPGDGYRRSGRQRGFGRKDDKRYHGRSRPLVSSGFGGPRAADGHSPG